MHYEIENPFTSKWIESPENVFTNTGLGHIWLNEGDGFQPNYIKSALKQRLSDMSKQEMFSSINGNRQCIVYRMFKNELKFESYLKHLNHNDRLKLCKFRCRNHFLPVTKNRFREVDKRELLCGLCPLQEIGDEFHYLLKCPFFSNLRKKLIGVTSVKNANVFTLSKIVNSKKLSKQKNLARFVGVIMDHFEEQNWRSQPQRNNSGHHDHQEW